MDGWIPKQTHTHTHNSIHSTHVYDIKCDGVFISIYISIYFISYDRANIIIISNLFVYLLKIFHFFFIISYLIVLWVNINLFFLFFRFFFVRHILHWLVINGGISISLFFSSSSIKDQNIWLYTKTYILLPMYR